MGSGIAVSCGVDGRRGSDPALLWLWCRPATVALIQPLAWEPPYAAGVAVKRKKKKCHTESQKLNSQVQDICVFNALKVTLEIKKAISFKMLITSNPILFFFFFFFLFIKFPAIQVEKF